MIGKRHAHLLRDIDGYIEILNNSENPSLGSLNFFIPCSYTVEGNAKPYPCYLLTRKGCDMVVLIKEWRRWAKSTDPAVQVDIVVKIFDNPCYLVPER